MDDDLNEPFGIPDGSIGAIARFESDFVKLHRRFGGVARPLEDASVRVVVGTLGAGKSLYLRMMRNAQLGNGSVYAEAPTANMADLSTDDVVAFSERSRHRAGNTEEWKVLWRRAIFRSAYSFIRTEHQVRGSVSDELLEELEQFHHLLGKPKRKRRVTAEASTIIREHVVRHELAKYLNDPGWSDAETILVEALSLAPPLFLYVDAIDDNFRWAPTHWMRCQRGLYYAVMDLLRSSDGAARLHVVIALRDIALASTRFSEHGPRYLEQTHINSLVWTRRSIRAFLERKVARLPDIYFEDPESKTVESWLSRRSIDNTRATPSEEEIESYLIRHTRLVPRDIVVQGNRLCRYVLDCRSTGETLTPEGLRREVAISSREFASSQLAQCANQVISDGIPAGATENDYASIYLRPNEYQMTHAVERICSALQTIGDDTFARAALVDLDASASDAFGQPVHLADILWQNRLIGTLDDHGASSFFSLDDLAGTTLPSVGQYVLNPILFDRIAELRSTLQTPHYPVHG
jgi:hypothetical protein